MASNAPPPATDQAISSDSGSTLLALPPELFERIAELTPAEDLVQLRLTCREAASKTERTFARAHFTDRGFLLCSKPSLQTAVKIVQHTKYRATMKKVTFYVDCVASSPMEVTNVYSGGSRRRIRNAVFYANFNAARQMLIGQHQELVRHDEDRSLLTFIFSILRYNNAVVDVAIEAYIGADDEQLRIPWGYTHCFAQTGASPLEQYDRRGFSVVMNAMALSGYRPQSLTVGNEQWSIPLNALSALVQKGPDAAQIMSTVRVLDLHVWTL
ncbi:hypothetical protein LTR85_008882 [Meristemomyces frigidus]|nr:hypothetical protein LTR85_008882 [Meristemomyces frigidus]